MIIYNVLKFVRLILPILLLLLGYYLFVLIKRKAKKEQITIEQWLVQIQADIRATAGKFATPLFLIVILASLVTSQAVHQFVGIHNLELKPEGTYCFYVEATNENGKTYVLPAEVEAVNETVDVSPERTKTYRIYYVRTVFFSNGGYLDTYDMDPLEISDHSWHETYDGDEWKIRLLNKHAYSPEVEETNNAAPLDIAYLIVELLIPAFFLFALLYKRKPKDSKDC